MTTLNAKKRETKTSGEISNLRLNGFIPGILYGGKEQNKKISLKKNSIKNLINSENFFSAILDLNIDGKEEKVLPRDISFDPLSDEPIHIDLLRIVKGAELTLETPVKFINSEKSPGLKKGGVLNIVRRKIELRCPTENIPSELVVDLNNTEIGTSIKISSIKLPENVVPAIQGRDFVVATVASPTVIIEPEKPADETVVEGEATTEASPEETEKSTVEEKDQDTKAKDQGKKEDKTKK
jgi:large subunit ribosomal protein L25|tara:strand:+ start:786 stop:1502 length:717 start_codon:yes stop_codon:yes gene_type:complete